MIAIDQLKAAMSLKSQFQPDDERTVGTWRNTKTATGVYTFQHAVTQWLFFSKGSEVTPAKYPDWNIDGWLINLITEKNKATSSKHEISLVFDKRNGIDKFWTEFLFLSTYCPSEMKLIRADIKIAYPLSIKSEGAWSSLEVTNPNTGEVEYTSKKFYKKNTKTLYHEDEEFRKWFDKAVDYACMERISRGLLKINVTETINEKLKNEDEPMIDELDPLSGDNVGDSVVEDTSPKKRGRRKKSDIIEDGFAESSMDSELSDSSIIYES